MSAQGGPDAPRSLQPIQMSARFLQKIYGNGVALANLPGQRRVPYASQEELSALRDSRLRRTVQYAAESVPYYRKLFAALKIDPQEIRCVEDLNRLPLLDKSMIHKDPDSFVSMSWRGRKSIPFLTSGSTGLRLRIHHDPHSLLQNIAFGEREREVVTALCGRRLGYKELYLGCPQWTITKVWDFYKTWTFLPVRPQRIFISMLEPVERIADAINRFNPDVIVGMGSYLELLFRMLALNAIRIHPPRILSYGGDSMTPEGKRFIERQFNVAILSHYNAVECFKIGFLCEQGNHFHLHQDLCHIRIVNASGSNAPIGRKGEVIISNLINRGTVLLNYRLGDIASLSPEKCGCGRSLSLLSELEGRVEDILFLPGGIIIHPEVIWSVFEDRNEVIRYQLIQHEPLRFELKVLTGDTQIYQRLIGGIVDDLRQLLGSSALIEAHYAEDLAEVTTSKFRPVQSRCKQHQLQ